MWFLILIKREDEYKWTVYPKKKRRITDVKYHWTSHEIEVFIQDYREKYFEENHDALIFIHRGHGGPETILSSDGKRIRISRLQSKVRSAWTYRAESIPRIFISDASRDTYSRYSLNAPNLATIYGMIFS